MTYKFNKRDFLKSDLGRLLIVLVVGLDTYPVEIESLKSSKSHEFEELNSLVKMYLHLFEMLNIIFVAIKQFYGLECKYEFTTMENSCETDFIVYCNDEVLYSSSQFKLDIN